MSSPQDSPIRRSRNPRQGSLGVWDAVIGQTVVPTLQKAAAQPGMASGRAALPHAWLFTGPPGSGRSVVARSFAAALQCPEGGCGECAQCHAVRARTHPDVTGLDTEGLNIKISQVRELVPRAAMAPARGKWQIVIVEDADRLGEDAADALLLAIEEPPPRTVWMLCAPTAEDIVATIRSRCRVVNLRTPPYDDVARHLVETENVTPEIASFAARAALGHIGRARALAVDEEARARRSAVLKLPFSLKTVRGCIDAAAALVDAAKEDADKRCDTLDSRETDELKNALGAGARGKRPRNLDAAVKELEREQKLRRTRVQRDSLDRALTDVMALYRDVLMVQLGVAANLAGGLVNTELRASIEDLANAGTPEATLRRMQVIADTREALTANAAQLLTLESMALALRAG